MSLPWQPRKIVDAYERKFGRKVRRPANDGFESREDAETRRQLAIAAEHANQRRMTDFMQDGRRQWAEVRWLVDSAHEGFGARARGLGVRL
jgi:hypothetical protein